MEETKASVKPKAKPKKVAPKRFVMVNPRNVKKRQLAGYVLAPEYKGKTLTEQRALDAGDPVAMVAPE